MKTKPTEASVEDYIASRASEQQRADCKALMVLLRKVTKQKPTMWGPSIVGSGSYGLGLRIPDTRHLLPHRLCDSRQRHVISVPSSWEDGAEALLSRLGAHRIGQGLPVLRAALRSRHVHP